MAFRLCKYASAFDIINLEKQNATQIQIPSRIASSFPPHLTELLAMNSTKYEVSRYVFFLVKKCERFRMKLLY